MPKTLEEQLDEAQMAYYSVLADCVETDCDDWGVKQTLHEACAKRARAVSLILKQMEDEK